MKILLFITGYRQLDEYKYFSIFLQQLELNNMCDIFIYCNNPEIQDDVLKYYQKFNQKNKRILITSLNSGFSIGGVEAVSKGIEMGIFNEYDYVIHLHPDVFITDDLYLKDVLLNNIDNDIVFFITKSYPNDEKFFSFDFFIFKPKLLTKNIFIEKLYSFTTSPEHYLHDMIQENNIKYTFIKRFDNNNWYPRRIDDHLKLYHEHDMNKVINLLQDRQLFYKDMLSNMIFLDLCTNMFQGLEEFTEKINLNKDTIVYCFEPNSFVYTSSKPKYDSILNNYKQLYHFNKAILDYTGKIVFNSHHGVWDNEKYIDDYTGGSNCLEINPKKDNCNGVVFDIHQELVDCIDIIDVFKNIVSDNNLNSDKCISVKCDIEGTEFKVLPRLLDSEYVKYIKEIHIEWHERFYINTPEYNSMCNLKQSIINKLHDNNINYFEHH